MNQMGEHANGFQSASPALMEARSKELVILPPLKAQRGANGGFVMTQKYIDGIEQYTRHWPGPVTSLVQVSKSATTDMDHTEFLPGDPRTPIEERPSDPSALAERLRGVAVVQVHLSSLEESTARICQELGVPVVFGTEYTPDTERIIMETETPNPVRRMRRRFWLWNADRIRRRMLKSAAGLQCSGLPVYQHYGPLHPNALLFFDNRVREEGLLTPVEMDAKAARLAEGAPLRLVFGGRLIPMKGPQELPHVASELRGLGFPFTLDIYGGGPLEGALREAVARAGLDDCVRLRGVLDFETGWIPVLKHETDLFVLPHLQGDPSSTYPEVMSCGTAIVGYDNEAFRGVAEASGSGIRVPMQQRRALAEAIARLNEDRAALIEESRKALAFSREHSFERTFERRVRHLIEASRL